MSRSIRFEGRVRTAARLAAGVGAVTVVAFAPTVGSASTVPSEGVVLTATMQGGEGRPRAQVLERLAAEVASESGGALTIDITYGNDDSYEQFQTGEYDLLLANARSMDSMGVTTFDALALPFLVNDDDQADRVAAAPVVDDMMAGLSATHATGLLFAPVYEEHLAVAGTDPLRTIDQLQTGIRIDPPSTRLDALFEALGATPSHGLNGDDWVAAIEGGDTTAAEFPTALATVVPQPSAMAANFAQFYEFAVIMIGDDSLAALDADQTAVLRSAAEVAGQHSIDDRLREDEAFRDACAEGATLTAMPYSLMGDIGRALDGDILDVLEDPQTRELYDAVKRAAGARTWAWPSECHEGEVTEYAPPAPPSTTFPEGVYRTPGRTRDQLLVSGVDNDSATDNQSEYIELTIEDGTATYTFHMPDGSEGETCSVSYFVDTTGRLVVPNGCGWEGTYTWWETSEGVALEAGPVDTLEYLQGDFNNSAIGLSALVRVQ